MGFVQVLRDDYTMISKDEIGEVTETMQHNAVTNIAYSSGNYIITDNGNNYTYAASGHIINILV